VKDNFYLLGVTCLYIRVLEEAHKNLGNNSTLLTEQTPTPNKTEVETVTEMVTKYNNMSASERIEFMTEINSSYEEEAKLKNNKDKE
jgi:hypothetical protein